MFRLSKLGFLSSIILDLKDDVLLCSSFMFVTSIKRQWITKVKKLDPIKKETDNNTGDGVSVDQLQSSQPGLVPQLSGKLTIARICTAQVMVDHFSDLTYVHQIRFTSQEYYLAGKSTFEIWVATF